MKSTAAARQITDPSRINPPVKAAYVHTHIVPGAVEEKPPHPQLYEGMVKKQFSCINLITQSMYIMKINAITFKEKNNSNFPIICHLEIFNHSL